MYFSISNIAFFSPHELPFVSFLHHFSLHFNVFLYFLTSFNTCIIFIMTVLKTMISSLLSHMSLFLLIGFSVDYGTNIFWIVAC